MQKHLDNQALRVLTACALIGACSSGKGSALRAAEDPRIFHANHCWDDLNTKDTIAYTRSGEGIYIADSGGNNVKLLASFPRQLFHYPAWSPDKRQLAFTFPGGEQLFVMDHNCNWRRLAADKDFGCDGCLIGPAWSPDGTQIAVGRIGDSAQGGIYLVNTAGTPEFTKLEFPAVTSDRRVCHYLHSLDWSPDGLEIIGYCWFELYRYNLRTRQVIKISDNNEETRETTPTWSPDGQRIAFVIEKGGARFAAQGDIYIMDKDGNRRQQVTRAGFNSRPNWSPDGRRIVFQRCNDGVNKDCGIYIMGSTGRNITRIIKGGSYPAWSP